MCINTREHERNGEKHPYTCKPATVEALEPVFNERLAEEEGETERNGTERHGTVWQQGVPRHGTASAVLTQKEEERDDDKGETEKRTTNRAR